jgi:hypothetical protein
VHFKVLPIKKGNYEEWITKKHYAKRLCNIMFAFGLFIDKKLEGVITFGMPPSSTLGASVCGDDYKSNVLELNRLITNDDLPKNTLSRFLISAVKMLPKPKIIISFADENFGHRGYIYQATNFIYTGRSSNTKQLIDKDGNEFHFRNIGHEATKLKCKINLQERIVNNLSDDLLKKEYLELKHRNRYTGHCYVATECYYHLCSEEHYVYHIKHEGSTHWFLKDTDGKVIDLTSEQFLSNVPYHNAKRGFFLTKRPSKRTKILIERVMQKPFKILKKRFNEELLDRIEITNYLRQNKGNYKTKDIDNLMGYKDCAGHWFRLDKSGHAYPDVDDWFTLKEILKFDSTHDTAMNQFILVPDSNEIIKKLGLQEKEILGKHRYIYLHADKRQKKDMLKKFKLSQYPYPKGQNNSYFVDKSQKSAVQLDIFL